MIDRLAAGRTLPPKVRRDIIERADGIPLFVQEMTRAVLEADDGSSREAVPATLQASLLSRLDRLGEAKEVAQLGAAIGREFSHDLLASVSAKPATELDRSLDRLVAAGLLFLRQPPPRATYLFNHATGAGCRLRHAAARSAPDDPCQDRRRSGEPVRRYRGEPARTGGAPLH